MSQAHPPALHRPPPSTSATPSDPASSNGLLAYQRVPSEMRARNANGHARNVSGVGVGVAPFEMAARSPPNSSTKSESLL